MTKPKLFFFFFLQTVAKLLNIDNFFFLILAWVKFKLGLKLTRPNRQIFIAEIAMSDQGREVVNRVNEELFQLCDTDHRINSAYHPQSNALDERTNQRLTRALMKFMNDNQNDWDVHIKSILFAYRTG